MEHVRFKHQLPGGEVLESDVIVTTPELWPELPQSRSGNWQSIIAGPLMIAHRALA
jgi:hypothetical protein